MAIEIVDYDTCCGAKFIRGLTLKDVNDELTVDWTDPITYQSSKRKFSSNLDYYLSLYKGMAYIFVPLDLEGFEKFKKPLNDRGFELFGRTGEAYMMLGTRRNINVL